MTTDTLTLTQFLEQCIDADEADAGNWLRYEVRDGIPGNYVIRDRVLRQCAALRAAVELHVPVDYSSMGMPNPNACAICGVDLGIGDWEWERDSFPCDTLIALVGIFADRPGFQEAWAL